MSAADVLILILDDERYFDDLFIVATVATTVYDCSKITCTAASAGSARVNRGKTLT